MLDATLAFLITGIGRVIVIVVVIVFARAVARPKLNINKSYFKSHHFNFLYFYLAGVRRDDNSDC